MRKKLFLGGVALLILVISFFAGEVPMTEPTMAPEVVFEQTATVPEEMPEPAEIPVEKPDGTNQPEPQTEPEGEVEAPAPPPAEAVPEPEKENLCTLSVRCDAVLGNLDKLADGKEAIVPTDGVIYREQQVEFNEGESVFDVLLREMKANQIHFEFVQTPMYNSVYIEGIGNLYEFDCGEYSGWLYRVNGIKPNVGCSQYFVKPGDVITVTYSCNFLKET